MKEKNKHTLHNALRQLPMRQPDEALWQRIEGQLAEAPLSDYQTIRLSDYQTGRLSDWQTIRLADYQTIRLADYQTIRLSDWQTIRLADYQTGRLSDWQRIEGQLAEAPLREALERLPLRQPSDDVWKGIEKQMGRRGQMIRLPLTRWAAIAAVLAGIGFGLHWLLSYSPARITKTYAQEQAYWPAQLPPADASDEEAFREIPRMLVTSVVGSAREEIAGLNDNLKELNDAVAETQSMIKRYGADGKLLQQIVELERERTLVLKQMAALL